MRTDPHGRRIDKPRKPILLPMPKLDSTTPRHVREALRQVFVRAIDACETFESVEDQNEYLVRIGEWAAQNLANMEGLAKTAGGRPIIDEEGEMVG